MSRKPRLKDQIDALLRGPAPAEQGDPDAQHNLSIMLKNGRGIAEDAAAAVAQLKLAAAPGHADAHQSLKDLLSNSS